MNARLVFVLTLSLVLSAAAATPKSAKASKAAKPAKTGLVPPAGTNIPPAIRTELESGVAALGREIESLRAALKSKPQLFDLLPDVQIFHNAVRYALEDSIFYKTTEFASARNLLKLGQERAAQLRAGQAPWTTATGSVVRGYISKLDGSVQPYGLVVPPGFKTGAGHAHRLDFWFHGRGDTLSEVNFLNGRLNARLTNEFTPADAFVLHPYGRYCNAYHFAGEVDAFEALDHAKKHYPIDNNKISVRGFSMGGAATWHMASHHAGLWVAANPGAGFTDVYVYQNMAGKEPKPAWYEQKLWRLYDATNYAANFFNTTLIAYSGELDKQKAAADMMERALAAEGMKMTHIIGPGVEHKYEPNAKLEVARLLDATANKGRESLPKKVRFVTFSLRYNQMEWVTVDALERHWERVTVEAEYDGATAKVSTKGVAGLTLSLPSGTAVVLDGTTVKGEKSAPLSFAKSNGQWLRSDHSALRTPHSALAKRHSLQGPIDDALMDSFMFVKPSGQPLNAKIGAWASTEAADAILQWRRQFRGQPRVKTDTAVTDADIANHNLILFGDPQSNQLLARIADKLPIKWTAAGVVVGGKTYAADKHVPVFIFPNPLNPQRYVVINSGFTFAEFGTASNSLQTPKLPDWAVVDITVPRAARLANGIVAANFFGEQWELLPDTNK